MCVVRGTTRTSISLLESSNLTEANVRKEIADAAGVCEGDVTKVDQLNRAPGSAEGVRKPPEHCSPEPNLGPTV
jgi:hypothetical protein